MVVNTSLVAERIASTTCAWFIIMRLVPDELGLDKPGEFFLDLIGRERLADIAAGAQLYGLHHLCLAAFRSDHDHRDVSELDCRLQLAQQLDSSHVRSEEHTSERQSPMYL